MGQRSINAMPGRSIGRINPLIDQARRSFMLNGPPRLVLVDHLCKLVLADSNGMLRTF